jgi:flagellin
MAIGKIKEENIMAMVVQHNMQAMNSSRMLGVTTGQQAKSTEKLSSGYKINRAADDAAGLTISEKMRKQINGLDRASTNAQDGVSAVQTAEGALTEVHSMLQRMNELAVQASNGTNSKSDREAIQSEVDQLNTEIDRVAETTKFNETYLLKGDAGDKTVNLKAHDAGIKGTFKEVDGTDGHQATLAVDLSKGAKTNIAGTEYEVIDEADIGAGKTYTDITAAKAAGKTTATQAITDITAELKTANTYGATEAAAGITVTEADDATTATTKVFTITGGTNTTSKDLSFNLHVGADSDMTNKIGVKVEAMNTKNLGINKLNVTDDSGIAATYAIDAIADAVQKVSSQRSSLGAVQNRLEHTISNLDNIVENTTSAESRIRDTDMADEMVNYSKNNILASAGQSMLAQANQSTQGVLSLLK